MTRKETGEEAKGLPAESSQERFYVPRRWEPRMSFILWPSELYFSYLPQEACQLTSADFHRAVGNC